MGWGKQESTEIFSLVDSVPPVPHHPNAEIIFEFATRLTNRVVSIRTITIQVYNTLYSSHVPFRQLQFSAVRSVPGPLGRSRGDTFHPATDTKDFTCDP